MRSTLCFEEPQRLLKRRVCIAVQQDIAKLSEIERSTLEQMRLGLSNKAVARKLGKSVKAIERHRKAWCTNWAALRPWKCCKVQVCPLHTCTPSAAPRTVVRKADTSA